MVDAIYRVDGRDLIYDKDRAAALMRLSPEDAINDPSLTPEERKIVGLFALEHVKRTGAVVRTFSHLNPAHLKMHLIKQSLNYFIPKIGGLPAGFKLRYDVSKVTQRVADRTIKLAEKVGECFEGKKWAVNPLNNFINLTKAGSEILIYIGEHDPHYLRWNMILMWNVWYEMDKMRREDPKGFNMFEILARAIPVGEDEK